MYYNKKYNVAKPERKKVALSNFLGYDENKKSRNLPCDYVDCVYNYRFKNNKLVAPYGVSEFKIGDYVFPPTPFTRGKIEIFCATMFIDFAPKFTILISHDGGVDYCVKGDTEWRHITRPRSCTCGAIYYINTDPCLFIAGKNGVEWFCNGEFYTVIEKEVIDICVHYERLFIVVAENTTACGSARAEFPRSGITI